MVASLLLRVTYGGEPGQSVSGPLQGRDDAEVSSLKFRRVAVFCAPRARVALDRARKRGSRETVSL